MKSRRKTGTPAANPRAKHNIPTRELCEKRNVLKAARVRPVVRPPEGVEVSVRQGRGKRLLFVINHTEQRQSVTVPAGKSELLTGKRTGGQLRLDRYGVAVVRL